MGRVCKKALGAVALALCAGMLTGCSVYLEILQPNGAIRLQASREDRPERQDLDDPFDDGDGGREKQDPRTDGTFGDPAEGDLDFGTAWDDGPPSSGGKLQDAFGPEGIPQLATVDVGEDCGPGGG